MSFYFDDDWSLHHTNSNPTACQTPEPECTSCQEKVTVDGCPVCQDIANCCQGTTDCCSDNPCMICENNRCVMKGNLVDEGNGISCCPENSSAYYIAFKDNDNSCSADCFAQNANPVTLCGVSYGLYNKCCAGNTGGNSGLVCGNALIKGGVAMNAAGQISCCGSSDYSSPIIGGRGSLCCPETAKTAVIKDGSPYCCPNEGLCGTGNCCDTSTQECVFGVCCAKEKVCNTRCCADDEFCDKSGAIPSCQKSACDETTQHECPQVVAGEGSWCCAIGQYCGATTGACCLNENLTNCCSGSTPQWTQAMISNTNYSNQHFCCALGAFAGSTGDPVRGTPAGCCPSDLVRVDDTDRVSICCKSGEKVFHKCSNYGCTGSYQGKDRGCCPVVDEASGIEMEVLSCSSDNKPCCTKGSTCFDCCQPGENPQWTAAVNDVTGYANDSFCCPTGSTAGSTGDPVRGTPAGCCPSDLVRVDDTDRVSICCKSGEKVFHKCSNYGCTGSYQGKDRGCCPVVDEASGIEMEVLSCSSDDKPCCTKGSSCLDCCQPGENPQWTPAVGVENAHESRYANDAFCCPVGSTAANTGDPVHGTPAGCCPSGTVVMSYAGKSACCDPTDVGFFVCSDTGSACWNGNSYYNTYKSYSGCCPAGWEIRSGVGGRRCCPKGSTGC